MKHLKRSLSLVLVLVMAIGMFGISANAAVDFPDADEITYTEAVDVLVGLGVFEGLENGKLNPTGDITREQAAKLIAYALLGKTAADALKVSADPFADVAANRWSAGYIAYCVNEGIINGKGDNKFDPTGKLTGIQFAKMLLCAVGYGVNDEFVGKNWDIEVSKFALSHGIFAGNLGANQAASISREVAALYLFNALTKVPTVKYSEIFGDYYTGSSVMNAVTGTVDPTKTGATDPYSYTLGYTKFNLLKKVANNEDAFGRPYYNWTQYGKQVSDTYTGTTANFTYTGRVAASTLYNDLGRTLFATNNDFTYIIDGETKTATEAGYNDLDRTSIMSGIAGAGATTEVYVTTDAEGKISVKIVIVNNYFGVVKSTSTNKFTNETTATIDVYVDEGAPASLKLESNAFEKGDCLVVNISKFTGSWVIENAEMAETVTGAVSAYGAMGYVKVNGTNYNYAAKYFAKTKTNDYSSVYNFYLDNQGNVVGALVKQAGDVNYDYMYISDSAINPFGALTGNASVKAVATFANGETAVINIAVKNANTKDAAYFNGVEDIAIENKEQTVETGFYSYVVTDGVYTLTGNSSTGKTDTSFTAPTGAEIIVSGEKLYLTSSTKLVLMNSGKSYTGYRNFPATLQVSSPAVYYELVYGSTNTIKAIYLYDEDMNVQSAPNFAYFFMPGESTVEGATYYFYDNTGAAVPYLFRTAPTTFDICTISVDANGYASTSEVGNGYLVKGVKAGTAEGTITVKSADASYFLTSNNELYYFGDLTHTCAIYDLTANGAKVDSLNAGDQVHFVVVDDAKDNVAVAIYIVG